jgi:hypothetical protein
MIRLDIQKEIYWIDLPAGVRLRVRPLSTPIMDAAKATVIKEILSMRAEFEKRQSNGESLDGMPDLDDEQVRHSLSKSLLVKALARGAVVEWEGVQSRDNKQPAELKPEAINDLMTIWFIAEEFWDKYTKYLELLVIEGNGLGLAATGISAAGLGTAGDAMSNASHAAGENATP